MEIVATILRGIEGTTYSGLKNVFVDNQGKKLEEIIEKNKEIYEW